MEILNKLLIKNLEILGCWNESIYGGDDALEWKEKIYELCKTSEYGKGDKPKAITKKSLLKNMPAIRNMVDAVGIEGDGDINIGYQVVGAICLHSGYDLLDSPGLKEKIIESIENDDWAKENGLRKNVCNNYKKIINEYDFNSPVNIEMINIFEENDDTEDDCIAKEFQEVFGILNARIKKIESSILEKSGNKDFDDGFKAASQEEVDFLTDFKELVARQEMMGILLERIKNGSISSVGLVNKTSTKQQNEQTDAGRADVAPG